MSKKQRIKNLELYIKKMKEKKISIYKLIKMVGVIKRSTMYSYFAGKYPLTPEHCAILADAIQVEVLEVFPQLNSRGPQLADVKDGPYDPKKLKDKVLQKTDKEIEKMEENLTITIEDMVTEAASLAPDDGFTLKSRVVVDHNDVSRDALSVQPETQVIIRTGVKAANIDMAKVIVHGLKKHMVEHECHILPTPIVHNGELCVIMYVHGKPLMVCRGMEVARLIFL